MEKAAGDGERESEGGRIHAVVIWDSFAVSGAHKPCPEALQQHFINLHCLIMFCIMDFLWKEQKDMQKHMPLTHNVTEGNRLLARGGHGSYTPQSLLQRPGKDEDSMSSVSLAQSIKLWISSSALTATSR